MLHVVDSVIFSAEVIKIYDQKGHPGTTPRYKASGDGTGVRAGSFSSQSIQGSACLVT